MLTPDDELRRLTRTSDHDSSHAAAARVVKTGTAAIHESLIMAAMVAGKWMTAAEIAERCAIDVVRIRKRTPEMARKGKIERLAEPHKQLRWRLPQ